MGNGPLNVGNDPLNVRHGPLNVVGHDPLNVGFCPVGPGHKWGGGVGVGGEGSRATITSELFTS